MTGNQLRLTVTVTYTNHEDVAESRLAEMLEQVARNAYADGTITGSTPAEVSDFLVVAEPPPLRDTVDDVWSEHPDHRRDDWQDEVFDSATNLGYWDWVENRLSMLETPTNQTDAQ